MDSSRKISAIFIVLFITMVLAVATLSTGPSRGTQIGESRVSDFGLQLTATIPSAVSYLQEIEISVVINNTLSHPNTVVSTMKDPAWGPCSVGSETGLEIYAGSYSYGALFNNGTAKPTPLNLYNISQVLLCPYFSNETYTFPAHSATANAQLFQGSDVLSTATVTTITYDLPGYWTGTMFKASLVHFLPGTYTVVVYDPWGNLIVGYFQVI